MKETILQKSLLSLAALIVLMTCLFSCKPGAKDLKKTKEEGIREFYNGKYQDAISLFDKVILYDSLSSEIFYYRGSAWFNIKEVDKAMADFNRAIRINPKYADAYATRGNIFFYLGKMKEACKDYKAADSLGRPNMRDKVRYCP